MKARILLSIVLLVAAVASANAQTVPLASIRDIMTVHPDTLAKGALTSSLAGDTVRIRGLVTVPPVVNFPEDLNKIMIMGNLNYGVYLRDPDMSSSAYVGIPVNCDTNFTASNFVRLREGQLVEMTVVINTFPSNNPLGTTQGGVLRNTSVEFLDDGVALGTLPKVTIADFVSGPVSAPAWNLATGSRYLGMKVEFNDLTVVSSSGGNGTRATIIVSDQAGNQMYVRDQSLFFRSDAAGIPTSGRFVPPPVGSRIKSLKGYISTNNLQGQTFPFMITPAIRSDLEIDASAAPPVIGQVRSTRTNAFPASTQTVPVSAVVRRGAQDIRSAVAVYKLGDATEQSVPLTVSGDTLYTGNIPAAAANTHVSWKIRVTDANNTVVQAPADSSFFHYRVLDRAPKISDIREQFTFSGATSYSGLRATVEGWITADAGSDNPTGGAAAPRVYLQDGNEAYSGILLNSASPTSRIRAFSRGDRVRISGLIFERFGVTAIDSISNTDATLLPEQGSAPAPALVSSSRDLARKRQGDPSIERWESMVVELKNLFVTDTNADAPGNFGEFFAVDAALANTAEEAASRLRVETDDGNTRFSTRPMEGKEVLRRGQIINTLRAVLFFSFGNYKLVPRRDSDYELGPNSVVESQSIGTVQVFPVPASSGVNVTIAPLQAQDLRVQIVNQLGEVVASYDKGTVYNTTTFYVGTNNLASGFYSIVVTSGLGVVSVPVVVQH